LIFGAWKLFVICILVIGYSYFEFVSDFVFRASDFLL
jgi:hypothetical protein